MHIFLLPFAKQGGGAKVARDYQNWRTIPVEGGESFVVNSSARHCKRCQSKIQDAVRAVDTGCVGAVVDASAGGGRDTDECMTLPAPRQTCWGCSFYSATCFCSAL